MQPESAGQIARRFFARAGRDEIHAGMAKAGWVRARRRLVVFEGAGEKAHAGKRRAEGGALFVHAAGGRVEGCDGGAKENGSRALVGAREPADVRGSTLFYGAKFAGVQGS